MLTSIDTFTTVIQKSVIKGPIQELTGKTRKISAEPIDSLILDIDSRIVFLELLGTAVSHPDYNQYDHIRYTWEVKKNLWKKEEVELNLSYFYQAEKQTNLLITKIE
jgi:hypothetical protein